MKNLSRRKFAASTINCIALLSIQSMSGACVNESSNLASHPTNKPLSSLSDAIRAGMPENDERWNRNTKKVQRRLCMAAKLRFPAMEDCPEFFL